MQFNNKIYYDIKDFKPSINKIKKINNKIILCQGHFNVIHPGHLRFLEFAKQQGDFLIVAIQGKEK